MIAHCKCLKNLYSKMSCEEWLKNIATEADLQVHIGKLRERIEFYKDENARMDTMIEKLKLLMQGQVKYLSILEGASAVDEVCKNSCILSEQEKTRKHSYYMSKIKLCVKMYTNLNEKLVNDIKILKIELDNSKCKFNSLNVTPTEDLKILEAKIKRYENELLKLERKNPWLKDSHLNLPDIIEQIEKLNTLRNTKEKLLEDLAIYKGLKPDITEANEQLKEVKHEYENIMQKITKL